MTRHRLLGANVAGPAAVWVLRRVEGDVDDAVRFYHQRGRQDVADVIADAVTQLRAAAALWRATRDVAEHGSTEVPPGDGPSGSRVLVDVTAAAGLLDLSQRRVRQLCGDGSLVAQKVGGRWLVDQHSVASYITRGDLAA